MKKIITKILILSSILFLLSACGSGDNNANNSESNSNSNNDGEETKEDLLKIGETGLMETTVDKYNLTIDAVTIEEEIEGIEPRNDVFILIDLTVENLGDSLLPGPDATDGDLFIERGTRAERTIGVHDFVDAIDEIEPGETESGQILYDFEESDYFDLIFGYAKSSVSTELTWRFTPEEAQ